MSRIAHLAAAPYLAMVLCVAGFATGAKAADMAPQVHETLADVPQAPYSETADAHADLALALTRAAATHKYVLLDFGGNWCPDCRITAGCWR